MRRVGDCDAATVAVTTLAAAAGTWCVRVHDVGPNADAVRVAAAWSDGGARLNEGRGEPIRGERS
jgi:dihydropteroate synthase